MTANFEVENIKCSGCINRITNSLKSIEGVDSVLISLENETIQIMGTFSRDKIIVKLNELGYPEKGNNSVVKKAKSYINCAIGKINE